MSTRRLFNGLIILILLLPTLLTSSPAKVNDDTGSTGQYVLSLAVDSNGDPIPGVTVSTDADSRATTDAHGNPYFVNFPIGTYTLHVDKAGYTFSPGSLTVSVPPDATGRDLAGTATSAPTATPGEPTTTSTPTTPVPTGSPAPPDDFEADDSCDLASAIFTDGAIQEHTFHAPGDEDWVSFEGSVGIEYLIEAFIPAGSPVDVSLELYDRCGGSLEESQDHAFTPATRLQFRAPADGTYYLRLVDHYPDAGGANLAYQVSVRAFGNSPTPGALVLVAGRSRLNGPLQRNIHNVANAVYRLFQDHGYGEDRIFYLATDPSLTGYDAPATVANLETALTTWAQDKVGPDRPLTLYMIDHGGYDKLHLDKPADQRVTPGQIDGWLSQLEAAVPGVKVNVFIEACQSGSFIDLQESLSGPGRVVIASTGARNMAWGSDWGAAFSDHFIAALGQSASLYAAFQTANWAVQASHPGQTPWLDDDGDGVANEAAEGQEASRRGFGFAGTLAGEEWPPYIVQASRSVEVEGGQGVIRAEVRDDKEVKLVWAVIYPRSYQPPEPGEEMAEEDLPTIVLQDQGDGWYAATYTGFDEEVIYRVVVFAEDHDWLEARPLAIQIGWKIYLPLVMRQ